MILPAPQVSMSILWPDLPALRAAPEPTSRAQASEQTQVAEVPTLSGSHALGPLHAAGLCDIIAQYRAQCATAAK